MCILRNWQVTFLLYTLGAIITEYIAKAIMEPRDYRVVFLIQKTSYVTRTYLVFLFILTLVFTHPEEIHKAWY